MDRLWIFLIGIGLGFALGIAFAIRFVFGSRK